MYACNGILFNHESPRRGETFVTRKITRGMSQIAQGLQDCLYMGNLDAKRDWGHAKDFVEMQWLMLQQEKAEDYVIATGVQYSIRDFIQKTAAALDLELRFEGTGVDEAVYVTSIGDPEKTPGITVGQKIVAVDPAYFRPAEVETLLGDPTKAKNNLGWTPKITLDEMVEEMVECDLEEAKKFRLLKSHGYALPVSQE